jgi:hypothetical protein
MLLASAAGSGLRRRYHPLQQQQSQQLSLPLPQQQSQQLSLPLPKPQQLSLPLPLSLPLSLPLPPPKGTVYAFLDADNVSYRAVPSILKLVDSFEGRAVRILAYSDFHSGRSGQLVDSWAMHPCVQLVDVPRWRGKNSSDIYMAVDIVRIAFQDPDMSHAVIATNDTDFRHVMAFLRSRGIPVMLVTSAGGKKQRASPALAGWADRHAHVLIEGSGI